MKAVLLEAFGRPLALHDLPDPVAGAGEAVVSVVAAPVLSYTDEVLSGARGYPLLLPLVPGVGAVGRIAALGPDATRVAVGDWVFCDPTVRARDDAMSPDVMLQGWIAPSDGARRLQRHFRHGPWAERMLMPLENVVPLGDLDPDDAGRWCALGSCLVPYGGLLAADLRAGETLVVSGATGHFGSAGVAVALAMGAARVVAAGRNEAVLDELRHRFGRRVVTVALVGDEEADTARLRAAAGGPVDKVLDLLPPLPDASPVRAAAMTVRAHGTVVLMGGLRCGLELPYAHLMRECITVRGQYMYPRDAPARLVALVRAGQLSLADFAMTGFPLARVNEAVSHAAASGGPFRMTVMLPKGASR